MRTKLTMTALALVLMAPGWSMAQQSGTTDPAAQPPVTGAPAAETEATGDAAAGTGATAQGETAPATGTTTDAPAATAAEEPAATTAETPATGTTEAPATVTTETPDATTAEPEVAAEPEAQNPIYALRGEQIVGQNLYGTDGEEIGEIENVVIRTNGREPAVVVGVGGFLGIGQRKVAVPMSEIELGPENRLTTALTEENIKSLQAYETEGYEELEGARTVGEGAAGG